MRIKSSVLFYVFIAFFFVFNSVLFSQDTIGFNHNFNLEIKQKVAGSNKQNTYVIINNKIFIFENEITVDGKTLRKKIYSKTIHPKNLHEIKTNADLLFDLQTEYINAGLGGIMWEITVTSHNKSKKIILESYSLKEILDIFNAINKTIPKRKPLIYIF